MTDGLRGVKTLLRYPFAALFVVVGISHFTQKEGFLRIMPPAIPYPEQVVAVTGVIESGLGAMLLLPKTRKWAAWALIPVLIAIFPANVYAALTAGTPNEAMPGVPPLLAWLRLPVQPLLVAWAWWYTRE